MAHNHRHHAAEEVDVTTEDGTVRIKQPVDGTHHKPSVSVIVNSELNPVNGFVDFLREHAIVGLAIGFVIGTQVQSLVKQLVASFIDPLFQLFLGKSLNSRSFTLHHGARAAVFPWGAFIYVLLDFFFVVIAIYMIVKLLKLDKLDQPTIEATESVPVSELRKEIERVKEEVENDK